MTNDKGEPSGSGGGERFHLIQPHRDPETNWHVDLAKNLEEYLLKICSGEVTGEEDGILSVNFAEAALLIQGSVQVYSRKVEYLYSLVLHALKFLTEKRQQEQTESTSAQPEGDSSEAVADGDDEPFLGLDDVPVEAKNSLDSGHGRDDGSNQFVKPPANLVVLEGDCFDTIGDVGELESYLLATHDLYRDFILLDPCDSGAVQDFLKGDKSCMDNPAAHRGSSLKSKTRKSFLQSPTRRSGGTTHKSPLGRQQDPDPPRTPPRELNYNVEVNDDHIFPEPPAWDLPENDFHEDGMNAGFQEPIDGSDSDDDDPWKPLNPHEPGTLKVKPFKKVNISRRQKVCSTKNISVAAQFPVARLNGTISPDLTEIWESQAHDDERLPASQSPPLYEKLRQSLANGGNEACNTFSSQGDEDEDNDPENNTFDFDQPDFDMPDNTFMDAEVSQNHANFGDEPGGDATYNENEVPEQEYPDGNASLEDLCRSHLDALLASIAETEKQTEMATRVSTWKQRIEQTLEEQDSHPPFDIQEYGERVLEKLSLGADSDNCMSFSDVVSGQEKHDVARTFSALLQLVNNGNTDLVRGEPSDQPVCYTAVNPFYVRLLSHEKRQVQPQFHLSKKRVKPIGKHVAQSKKKKGDDGEQSPISPSSELTSSVNGNPSVKPGKNGTIRHTPEGKRRRRSTLVDEV